MSHRPPPVKGKAWQHFSFEERFKASFAINKKTGCWEWDKIHPTAGYGGITHEGKQVAAHRASWIFHNGAISGELCVLHKCDNRSCVNPEHLYLGDKKQNRKDFMERHPRAKELVAIGQKAGAVGAKKFWDNMGDEQRKEFCRRRSVVQLQKNGGKGSRSGSTFKWITNGLISKMCRKDIPIPAGWKRGRIF